MIDLSKLVKFVGEEGAALTRVKEAVHWLAGTPEGMTLLKDAERLHQMPLEIVAETHLPESCYGDRGLHVIDINFADVDKSTLLDQGGAPLKQTLERLLGHELKHAGQLGLAERTKLFAQRAQQIANGVETEYAAMIQKITPEFEAHFKQLQGELEGAAKSGDRAAVEAKYRELFDRHMTPLQFEKQRMYVERLGKDPVITKHFEDFELPAIEAENAIAARQGEKLRKHDYLGSLHLDTIFKSEREMTVNTLTDATMESARLAKEAKQP